MAGPGEGGAHPPSFLAHQSPQFQHEFPKLSSGDGQAPATGQKGGSDTQYGPGPSLRPQSECGHNLFLILYSSVRLLGHAF
jgi:hypothetical protein